MNPAVLIILAVLAWGAGVMTLSNATLGVGAIATACLFGIFARIAQASAQHAELRRLLAKTPN